MKFVRGFGSTMLVSLCSLGLLPSLVVSLPAETTTDVMRTTNANGCELSIKLDNYVEITEIAPANSARNEIYEYTDPMGDKKIFAPKREITVSVKVRLPAGVKGDKLLLQFYTGVVGLGFVEYETKEVSRQDLNNGDETMVQFRLTIDKAPNTLAFHSLPRYLKARLKNGKTFGKELCTVIIPFRYAEFRQDYLNKNGIHHVNPITVNDLKYHPFTALDIHMMTIGLHYLQRVLRAKLNGKVSLYMDAPFPRHNEAQMNAVKSIIDHLTALQSEEFNTASWKPKYKGPITEIDLADLAAFGKQIYDQAVQAWQIRAVNQQRRTNWHWYNYLDKTDPDFNLILQTDHSQKVKLANQYYLGTIKTAAKPAANNDDPFKMTAEMKPQLKRTNSLQ